MSAAIGKELLVALVVGAAATWLGRRAWRAVVTARAARSGGCDRGCGCGH